MNWNKYPHVTPLVSGEFLISVSKGKNVFNYVASYNHEQQKWYQRNPFNDSVESIEIIDTINGWCELSAYLG